MYDYAFLEEQLTSLISSNVGWLTRGEMNDVSEFTKVGEYGLAYETLCSIIVERSKRITPQMYAQLIELGQKMGMAEDVWLKLQPHVTPE